MKEEERIRMIFSMNDKFPIVIQSFFYYTTTGCRDVKNATFEIDFKLT